MEDQANAAHGKNVWAREWDVTKPTSAVAKQWEGWGTALKPAHEPIVMARKPLEGTVAHNIQKWGTGAINVDGCRVKYEEGEVSPSAKRRKSTTPGVNESSKESEARGKINYRGNPETFHKERPSEELGRFPANFIHDESEEVLDLFPETNSGAMKKEVSSYDGESNTGFLRGRSGPSNQHGDNGSAARFFYCAKATKKDRTEDKTIENNHPTVKPTELMRYLCRLVTPRGGIVLDPFMGSGSTGKAALKEGFEFIGIDSEEKYVDIARQRVKEETNKGEN